MDIFQTLSERNSDFSIVWLVHIFDKNKTYEMFLSSTNDNFVFNNQTYTAEAFSYKSNSSKDGFDGGGTLQVATIDNQIIELVESQKLVEAEILQILVKGNEKEILSKHHHKYGKPSVERGSATFVFDADDRPSMTFPSLVFSAQNNRGNS